LFVQQFDEWYQKTNKKEINYIGIQNYTYSSQHTVGDPKTQILLWGFCTFWGPQWVLLGFTVRNQILLWGICPFGEFPKFKFYPGVFCPFWGSLGSFGVQGPKIKFYSGEFVLLGSLPNSPRVKFEFGPIKIVVVGFGGPQKWAKDTELNLSLGPHKWAKAPSQI
jgi:hypothetical protein